MEYNTGYGRWFPHASTMRSWALNQIRVYRPQDNPATLITMPDKLRWPAMSPSEYPYLATTDVPEPWERSHLPADAEPWVSNNQIITALNEDEIDDYDTLCYNGLDRTVSEPPSPQLTPLTMLAGILLSLGPPQQNGQNSLILSVLENDNPYMSALLQDTGHPPIQPNQHSQSSQPNQPNLPSHVATIMIHHAIHTGATCPITMEPLTAKNATVTSCGHVFDRDALRHWTTDHGSCPECRTPVSL